MSNNFVSYVIHHHKCFSSVGKPEYYAELFVLMAGAVSDDEMDIIIAFQDRFSVCLYLLWVKF